MSLKKNAVLGFACLMLLFPFSGKALAAATKYLVRIQAPDQAALKIYDLKNPDIASRQPGKYYDLILEENEYFRLSGKAGVELLTTNEDPKSRPDSGTYHSLAEIDSMVSYIAETYPGIAKLCTLNIRTWQDRPILALKLSDNVNVEENDEPEILFMGCHHAREWPTVEITTFIADTLTRAYGSDPVIKSYLDNNQIWIVPCVNPDGFNYDYEFYQTYHNYAWWRKNFRDNNNNLIFDENYDGVDLNRNYYGALNGERDGDWGVVWQDAATHDIGGATYCGPYGMSEPEIQAVKEFVAVHSFVASISWHTYTECVMWPWAHNGAAKTEYDYLLVQTGDSIAGRITKQSETGTYASYQASGLYPVTGDTNDWLYGYSMYLRGKNILPFIIEACEEFIPDGSALNQIVRENFQGGEYLLQQASNLKALLKPKAMPPENLSDDGSGSGNFSISWSRPQSGAVPTKYAVRELKNCSIIEDGFETTGDLWELEGGFVSATARFHSGAHSLYSGLGDDIISIMTTKRPMFVNPGDSLTFWCWYNTELMYDVIMVEVSSDKREWKSLEKISGSSGAWQRKSYSLGAYANQYLYFRIRYLTDGGTYYEGLYVDDFWPTAVYASDTVLDSAVVDTSFALSKTLGDYYYLVRGYEAEHGWGDYCQPHRVDVVTGVSGKPSIPDIIVTKLEMIKPNPATAPVKINYQLSFSGRVDLSIYDIMGRRVKTLVNGIQSAGTKGQVLWDGRDESGRKVSSGIYIYRLATPDYSKAYKVILIK